MTTKQAADIIRMLLGYLKGEIEPPKQETIEEAKAFEQQGYECLEMAIKALEQQPCEDAISRQAVLDGVDRYIYKSQSTGTQDDFYSFAELVVKELPSVTPKSKSEYEHDHDVVKAYNDGQAYILDKIKAEIEGKMNSGQWSEAVIYGMKKTIAVIDKYRESEDKE